MKKTPAFNIPYLDGSEKAYQIIDASKQQAEAVDNALRNHGINPPNLDAISVASRLSAVEAAAESNRTLPLVHASRSTAPAATNSQWVDMNWERFTTSGAGLAYTNGSNRIVVQKRAIYLLVYSGEVRGETLALQIKDKNGANVTSAESSATGSAYASVQLLFVAALNPGDELRTTYRCSGTTKTLSDVNTFFSVIGLRDLSA